MRMRWVGLSLVALTMVGCTFDDADDERATNRPEATLNEVTEVGAPETPARATVSTLADLQAIELDFPEGLAVREGEAFVGLAPKYRVSRVGADGQLVPFAKFPDGGFGTSSGLIGIAFDANGRLYGAVTSESGKVKNGIYRTGPEGGDAELFATDPALVHPNGLAFSQDGTLFFSDSATGSIWFAGQGGGTAKIAEGPLLEGDASACPDQEPKRANRYGANGLVVVPGGLLVVNTEKATVSKVTLAGPGTGMVETIYGPDCENLYGADGIAIDVDEAILVAAQWTKRIVRIKDGKASIVAQHASMTAPASIAWRDGEKKELLVTNFPVDDALALRPAKPAVLAATFAR